MTQGIAYGAVLRGSFAQAAERSGTQSWDLELAGQRVRVLAAEPELARRFQPAQAHRVAPFSGAPDLTIHLWADAALPAPPLQSADCLRHGEVQGLREPGLTVIYEGGMTLVYALDLNTGEAWYCARCADTVPAWEDAAPFRVIYNRWFLPRGGHVVHGAALGDSRLGAVLLAGPGGSGKSTTALRWLARGGGYLSDDYTLLTRDGDGEAATAELTAHSLYCTAKVVPEDAQKHPELKLRFSQAGTRQGEKPAALLYPQYADQLVLAAPVRAFAQPVVAAPGSLGAPRLERCPGRLLWQAMVLPTIQQLHGTGRESMQFLSSVVASRPSYRLDLAGERDAVPPLIREFLLAVSQ